MSFDDEFGFWDLSSNGYDIDEQFEEVDAPKIELDFYLKEDQLPNAISSQVKVMDALEKRIKEAQERVNTAKNAAEIAKHKVSVFKKKQAIEELQYAVLAQSEAISSENEAMGLLFSHQKQLANVSNALYAFGLMIMTTNRTMYQRLKCELEKASEEELNELAREELMRIVRQLKAQEDIYNRIDRHSSSIESLQKEVTFLKSTMDSITNPKRQEGVLRSSGDSSTQPSSSLDIATKKKLEWTIALAISVLIIFLAAIAIMVYLKGSS